MQNKLIYELYMRNDPWIIIKENLKAKIS